MLIDRRTLILTAAAKAISPFALGLKGDGSDETERLQAFVDFLGMTGGHCTLPPGRTYLHSKGIVFGGGSFHLDANGSTFRMMDGVVSDAWHFGVKFTGHDFSISNLIVDGNRQRRTPREAPCHSFYLEGVAHARFDNCTALNAVCDGWIIWERRPENPRTWCRDVVLNNCRAANSFRNGLSIINGYDILISGGRYDRSQGTPPQAGIDLEADPGSPEPSMDRVRLVGVQANANAGYGFVLVQVGNPRNIEWDNLVAVGDGASKGAVGFRIYSPVRASRLRAMRYPTGATIRGAEFIHER